MIVERVIELGSQLQVHAFGQSRLFRDREINVLVVRTPKSRVDARTGACVSKRPSASGTRAVWLERSGGLKSRGVQQRSAIGNVRWATTLSGVEIVDILQERIYSRNAAN